MKKSLKTYKIITCLYIQFVLSPIYIFSQWNDITNNSYIKNISNKIDKDKIENTSLLSEERETNIKHKILNKPINEIFITSKYGDRLHPIYKVNKFHNGIDIKTNKDTIRSIHKGIVEDVGYNKSLGNYIKITNRDLKIIYGHLHEFYVLKGQQIQTGQKIALSGNTGLSTGEHLHLSIKIKDKYINPIVLLNKIKRYE